MFSSHMLAVSARERGGGGVVTARGGVRWKVGRREEVDCRSRKGGEHSREAGAVKACIVD